MADLLPIRDAQEKILAVFSTLDPESCSPENAYDRVLALDVFSPFSLPSFVNSSMDGFAVHCADLVSASTESPVFLPVCADIPAGFSGKIDLPTGFTARILTGAPVPQGADAVIPVEDTDQFKKPQDSPLPDRVGFYQAEKIGANIRWTGEDLKHGQRVLESGKRLKPQDVGLLISLGMRSVQVVKKPRIALFSSGDELLTPDEQLFDGKLYDANAYVMKGIFNNAGAEVVNLGIARDNPQSVRQTLDQALDNPPDLIVGSAGVSVGAFDFVRQVIESNGSLDFWRVNMRPGKPIAFGSYKGIPFIGLPGNPVSAYVGSLVFVLPCINQLLGLPPHSQSKMQVTLDDALKSSDGRESFYRGVVRRENGVLRARLTGHQGSGNLFSLVQANALLVVPAGSKYIPAGEQVVAWMLDTNVI